MDVQRTGMSTFNISLGYSASGIASSIDYGFGNLGSKDQHCLNASLHLSACGVVHSQFSYSGRLMLIVKKCHLLQSTVLLVSLHEDDHRIAI